MKRWMVRARYAEANANDYFREHYGFKDGQWLYLKNLSFTDKESATLHRTIGAAKGKLTGARHMAVERNYSLPVDIGTAEIVEIKIVIPGDDNEN